MSKGSDKEQGMTKEEIQAHPDKEVLEEATPQDPSDSLKAADKVDIQGQQPSVMPEHQIKIEEDQPDKTADDSPGAQQPIETKGETGEKTEAEAEAQKDAENLKEPESGTDGAAVNTEDPYEVEWASTEAEESQAANEGATREAEPEVEANEEDASPPSRIPGDENLDPAPGPPEIPTTAETVGPSVASSEEKGKESTPEENAESKEDITSDSVPNAPDSVRDIATNESLDVMDLASGDADGTEPTREQPDGDPVAEKETAAKDTRPDDPQSGTQSLQELAEANNTSETDSRTDEAQEDTVPTVEPATAADVVLPDPGIAEPEAKSTGDPLETDPSGAKDLFDDDPASLPDNENVDVDSKLIDGDDPVAIEGAEESSVSPPVAGPIAPADIVGSDQIPTINELDFGDAPGPVSDTSGIESGNVLYERQLPNGTETVYVQPDGSKYSVVVLEQDDGSERIIHVTDEGITTIETNLDGTTKTIHQANSDGSTMTSTEDKTTTVDPDGTVTEKHSDGTVITYHPKNEDGSSVVEKVDPDGTVTETHSDGTVITYHPDGKTEIQHPDGKTEVIETEEKTDETQEQQTEDNESSESEDEEAAAEDASKADDGSEATGRPVDDTMVDPDTLAAFHEAEFAFQQAVREGSVINPVRDGEDVGTPEGSGDPPPGVDDPPEGEAPRTDELPEEDPVSLGLSGGDIDFGPDHVEEQEANTDNSHLTEEIGAQAGETGQTEADPTGLDIPLKFDPEAVEEAVDDVQQATTGIDADEVLTFTVHRLGAIPADAVASVDDLGDEVTNAVDIAEEFPIQTPDFFEVPEALEGLFSDPPSESHADDDQDSSADDADLD